MPLFINYFYHHNIQHHSNKSKPNLQTPAYSYCYCYPKLSCCLYFHQSYAYMYCYCDRKFSRCSYTHQSIIIHYLSLYKKSHINKTNRTLHPKHGHPSAGQGSVCKRANWEPVALVVPTASIDLLSNSIPRTSTRKHIR